MAVQLGPGWKGAWQARPFDGVEIREAKAKGA